MARLSQMGLVATVTFGSGFTAEVKDIQISGLTRDNVPVTNYGSGDFIEEDPAARASLGTAEITINFDPALYDTVISQITDSTVDTITITFPLSTDPTLTGATLVFDGFVNNLPLGLPSVGGISASMGYQLTSNYTFTPEA